MQQARASAHLALGCSVWLCFDKPWPWPPHKKKSLGHNSLCGRKPFAYYCQNHILKGRLSVLISLAFSLQVVDVKLLKSPLNVCRKLVFNQVSSKPNGTRKLEAGNLVESPSKPAVNYSSSHCPPHWELRTPLGNLLGHSQVRCYYFSTFWYAHTTYWKCRGRVPWDDKSHMKL